MKIFYLVLLFLLFAFGIEHARAAETKVIAVEVLHMNHGPMRGTINRLRETFAKYEGKISESWHDFESKDSDDFKKVKGINYHTPCVIWIDGSHTFKVDGRDVSFIGFPTGAGPAQFQGKWTFEDLVKVLDATIARNGK